MAQAPPGPPAPAVDTALCDDDTDDGKMTAVDKSRLEVATAAAAEQQGGRQTDKNASTPSRRGRFTLELVEERRHHYQHTEQQLYVTHANCDLALSPVPSSSLVVITPQQQRKFVKKVGRFVVEEDVDVETTTNSESGSGSTARASSRRRIGRFEVAPHEGSGSVTPTLMVYPVLER